MAYRSNIMTNQRRRTMRTRSMSEAMEEDIELDRFSMLPCYLIAHILSLVMDTKFAIQTCVLSKRWRNLWTHLPSLYLDDSRSNGTVSFRRFARNIMSKREPNRIQTLRFMRSFDSSKSNNLENIFLDQVIDHTTELGVEELDTNNTYFFRGFCKSFPLLRSLKLTSFRGYQQDTFEYHKVFESVTRLHLEGISLITDSVDIFSRCINLRELVLIQCGFPKALDSITISSPNLVNLTTKNVSISGNNELIISAPRLLELNLKDIKHPLFVQGCHDLERIEIDFGGNAEGWDFRTNYTAAFSDFNLFFVAKLQCFYQDVVKNVITKSKSLVLKYYGWKWVLTKGNNSAFIEIFAPKIDLSIVTLTWKIDAEYDWNEGDFVSIFGMVGFVFCPAIICTMSSPKDRLDESLKGILRNGFSNKIKKILFCHLIMVEQSCIEAAFGEIMSPQVDCDCVSKRYKCSVTRKWNNHVVWQVQWPK